MPFAATVTVPCDGAVLDVTVRVLPRSFVRTDAPLSTTPAAVVPLSARAFGVTMRDTVAVEPWPEESFAVYVKESGPE